MTEKIDQEKSFSSTISGKFFTFSLGKEQYGVEIVTVQEIIQVGNIIHVPHTPNYVRGVINLRGKIIPVIDLRLRFSMEPKDDTIETSIIIFQRDNEYIGTVIDRVQEVIYIDEKSVEIAPDFGENSKNRFVKAIAHTDNGVKILLDLDETLEIDEMKEFHRFKNGKRVID